MMTLTKLNDVFDDWLTGDGIFTDLNEFGVPWKTGEETDDDLIKNLNMAYHGSHSGDKNISPIVHKFLTSEDTETRAKLAGIIYIMFGDKWSKLWDAFSVEYNPIENYSMVETMTDDTKVTDYGRTSTRTDNLTDTNTPNLTNNTDNSKYAFNSSSAVPTDEMEQRTTGTNTDTHTGTQGYVNGGRDTETRNYELTRSGNIGVTTSQQMIESERRLRMWNFFEMVVFPDIDRVLTIKIY